MEDKYRSDGWPTTTQIRISTPRVLLHSPPPLPAPSYFVFFFCMIGVYTCEWTYRYSATLCCNYSQFSRANVRATLICKHVFVSGPHKSQTVGGKRHGRSYFLSANNGTRARARRPIDLGSAPAWYLPLSLAPSPRTNTPAVRALTMLGTMRIT